MANLFQPQTVGDCRPNISRDREGTKPNTSSHLLNFAGSDTFNFTRLDRVVLFTMDIGFFDGYAREPKAGHVEGAICGLSDFIDEDLQHALVDEEAKAFVYIIDWTYSEGDVKPVSVDFAVEGIASHGEPIPTHTLFDALKLDSTDLGNLIKNYLWNAPPNNNVFHDTAQIGFKASTGVPPPSLQTASAINCDAPCKLSTFANCSQPKV